MWDPIIGLEIHVQLNTKSKIFSSASTNFGAKQNTQACAIDLGLPGVLPVLNEQAVFMAIKFGLAIGAKISNNSIFARKNYFYPDLPKGYQISQYERPLALGGGLDMVAGSTTHVGLTRIHMEEDAGKSLHEGFPESNRHTHVDYNRSGVPLIEIATERMATINAAWDLASHDVYIFNSILDERPVWVSCVGASYLRKPVEDIVFLTLGYPDGVIGHIHVSWLDPKKVRTLTVVGEKKMLTWDESAVPGPVMVYDCSVVRDPQYETFGDFQLLTKEGDVVVPRVQLRESLAVQARSFVDRCLYGAPGDKAGSAKQGAEVVDVLVAAEFSLKEDRQIEVTYGD